MRAKLRRFKKEDQNHKYTSKYKHQYQKMWVKKPRINLLFVISLLYSNSVVQFLRIMFGSAFDSYKSIIQEVLYQLILEMQNESQVYDPSKYALMIFNHFSNKFGSSKQEDAHEFLGYVIEQFSQELKKKIRGTQ